MQEPATLLLVDDDSAIRDVLLAVFHKRYTVVIAADGLAALHQIETERPDLVLMDLRLPDIDGILLISTIRKTSQVPIVVLSVRHEQVDVVTALKNGADDFVFKPFDIDDLDVRIETVLRRARRTRIIVEQPATRYGTAAISLSGGLVIDSTRVPLTPMAHKLCTALMEHGGELVSRSDLRLAIWGFDDTAKDHELQVYISRLRESLRTVEGAPKIATTQGHGYRMITGA